jgi:hypothetical protein
LKKDFVKELNNYVGLNNLKTNRTWIVLDVFVASFFFLFFYANSLLQNFDLLTSGWMIFAIFLLLFDCWGVFLFANLEKRQIHFLLFHGMFGLYLSAELFSLGFSYGTGLAHIHLWILVSLIILDAPFLCWIIWIRKKKFKEINLKETKKTNINPLHTLLIPLILTGVPLINLLSDGISKNAKDIAGTIIAIFLGYVMSMLFVYICNYFVAKKYKDYIRLYENEKNTYRKNQRK